MRFALDGREYEIDLNDMNDAKLRKTLHPYAVAGRRLGRPHRHVTATHKSAGGSGMTNEELANVRGWARSNGYEVSDRGRIKGDVVAAYHAAH